MNRILLLLVFISGFANAQIVSIPDANFKAKLLSASTSNSVAKDVNNLSVAIDTNSDGEIQVSEASVIYSLNVMNAAITNLNGIDSFVNLSVLNCSQNGLTALDATVLPVLTDLNCSGNPMLALNVSGLTNLKSLTCMGTEFTTLNVSSLVNLEVLEFTNSLVSSINVSGLTNLKTLHCGSNGITTLNLSGLVNLESLFVYNNNLTSLDLTGLTNLNYLHCTFNQLSTLDVSFLTNLTSLHYGNPGLAAVDITGLNNLEELEFAQGTQLPANLESLPNLHTLAVVATFITDLDVSYLPLLTGFIANGNTVLSHVNLKHGGQFGNGDVNFINNANLAFVCANDVDVANIATGIVSGSGNGAAVVNSYCSFTPGGDYNTITGSMTYDANNNGCEVSDPVQPNIKIILNDGTNQGATFTNNSGNYTFYTETGNFVVLPAVENPSWFTFSPPVAVVPFANDNNNVATQNFCIAANGIHPDLEIVIAPIIPARPGFEAMYQIVYKNKGNQILSQANGISLSYNQNLMGFVSATVAPAVNSGTLSWSYLNLLPFENRTIYVTMNINTPQAVNPVNNGDVLSFTATVLATADETPLDNTFQFSQIVVGSFDPNDITCIEGATVPTSEIGNYLHYVINFENTGTFEAENIVVRTDIDATQFDVNSLQLLNTSHNAYVRQNGNVVEFIFPNIALDTGGHGNILLKIRSKVNLVDGDVVAKRADIFFDYNFPIDTGAFNTTFQSLGTNDFEIDNSVTVYPNPTKDKLNINSDDAIKSVQLYDIQGRLLQTKLGNTNEMLMDISTYNTGIYFVKVHTEKGIKVNKIIKE